MIEVVLPTAVIAPPSCLPKPYSTVPAVLMWYVRILHATTTRLAHLPTCPRRQISQSILGEARTSIQQLRVTCCTSPLVIELLSLMGHHSKKGSAQGARVWTGVFSVWRLHQQRHLGTNLEWETSPPLGPQHHWPASFFSDGLPLLRGTCARPMAGIHRAHRG